MGNSIEINFERVEESQLPEALQHLMYSAEGVLDICSSEGTKFLPGDTVSNIAEGILNHEGDSCISIRLFNFSTKHPPVIPLLLVRIIKYQGCCDIELSFDLPQEDSIDAVVFGMWDYSKKLAKKAQAFEYYCGMEPARDLDTRYFTNNTLGPLVLGKS